MKKSIVKKGLVIALALTTVLSVCSCGKKKTETSEDKGKYTSSEVLEKVLDGITDLPEMVTIKSGDANVENKFELICDLELDKVEDFAFTNAKENTKIADEICILRMKSKSDMAIAKKSLEDRIDDRKGVFNYYDPAQVPKLDKAVIDVKGNYIMLIVSDQASNGKYEFNKFLGE